MNVMIFGAGIWGRRVADYILQTDDHLVGFLDNNPDLKDTICIRGVYIKVYRKTDIPVINPDRIIIAIQSFKQSNMVKEELKSSVDREIEILSLREEPDLFFNIFAKTLRYDENDHRVSFLRDFSHFCGQELNCTLQNGHQ